MKKQTKTIGIVLFLFLLVIFSFISAGHSYPHNLLMEEKNNTPIQKINLVASRCNVCETEDNEYNHSIMRPDSETLAQWIEHYNSAPKAITSTESETQMKTTLGGANFSLLSHLEYTPDERNQGSCGNCWAWAGTGVLGIALDVQENIKERLSVQYINSCEYGVIGKICCGGGWLYDLADFYENTSKAIPWSNTNASWQDGDESCDTGCGTISANPRYPITSINEETIITHDVTHAAAIANIKSVLNQGKAVWFAFFLPTSTNWTDFYVFWNNGNESSIYDIDQSCDNPYGTGGGHAVLCVGYNDNDINNSYWVMLNSWGNSTSRPNGLLHINMDMNYSGTNPGIEVDGKNYSFYWQTLNVTFDIDIPKVTTNNSANVEETSAKLNGYLQSNGSVDTTCYFVWDTNSGEPYDAGNQSMELIGNQTEFSYNLTNLTKGELYYYNTKANNIAGWNNSGGEFKLLTRPDPLTSFSATMINSSKIVLAWADCTGGDGAYIEYAAGSQPDPWYVGNGTAIDTNGYVTTPFNHTNLPPNKHYYYKAWTYAEDDGWKSSGNITAPFGNNPLIKSNKTNALPVITGEFPSDDSAEVDKMQPAVNATIKDPDGELFNWTIKGTNVIVNFSNDDENGSKSVNLSTPLPYDANIVWHVNVTDGRDWTNTTYNFTTRSKYVPNAPVSLDAVSHNRTQLNLTWDVGSMADKTLIKYKQGTTPPTGIADGIELYNHTGISVAVCNLSFDTQYSFKAWSWNTTDSIWSVNNATSSARTDENIAPSSTNSSPVNNSPDQELSITWAINISAPNGDVFNWSITCSNGNTNNSNDDSGGVKNLTITGLNYNTTYTVWVNATDSYNWTKEWFNFTTRLKYLPYHPSNFMATADGADTIKLTWAKGNKADNTSIEWNSTEYWPRGNGTLIYNGTETSYRHTNLDENTQYFYQAWSWNDTDGCWSISNGSSNATTEEKSGGNPSSGWSPPPIINQEPNADAGGPYAGYSGIAQTFDGSGSNDSDGNIIFYEWNFGDGTTGTGEQLVHIYKNVGNYTVTLTTTDDDSAISENTTYASVSNLPPKKPILDGVTNGTQDTSYEYTIVSTDPNNDTIRYIIDWNDNSNNTKTNLVKNNTIEHVTHIWKSAGIYDVGAYVTDKNNASSESAELIVLIDIQYCNYTGYLIDHNGDGTYDSFYCNETWKETAVKQKGEEYLIDSNDDGNWNYTFDSVKGFATYQKKDLKETPEFGIILVFCAIALLLFIETKLKK